MARRNTEILVGAASVILGAAVLVTVYADGQPAGAGYPVSARFQRADGLSVGSEVRLSGVVVGRVVAQSLDPNYRAVVTMRLQPSLELSDDTAAVIHTDGLLGPKYVSLELGGSDRIIQPGGEIVYTQEAIVIEDLLATIIAEAKAKRTAEQEQGAGPNGQ